MPLAPRTLPNTYFFTNLLNKFITSKFMFKNLLGQFLGDLDRGSIKFVFDDGYNFSFNGKHAGPDAIIHIHSIKFIRRLITRGYLGLAEGYIAKDWSTSSLSSVFEFGTANENVLVSKLSGKIIENIADKIKYLKRKNTISGSKKNIADHYDLGNEFFASWLDPTLTYSSGIYDDFETTSLEHAQINKFRRIANTLNLKKGQKVLEIGCGWGGFLEFAASEIGVNITALTISEAQYRFVKNRIDSNNISQNATVILEDYRHHKGSYDKIVSIEMLEAVGEQYWQEYFSLIANNLVKGGEALLQVITIPDDIFAAYRKNVDFIQKYIFPGGMLIPPSRISQHSSLAGLKGQEFYYFNLSYSKTLDTWRETFMSSWDQIKKLGFDENFKRMWEYYLAYTSAGFKSGLTGVGHFHFIK